MGRCSRRICRGGVATKGFVENKAEYGEVVEVGALDESGADGFESEDEQ